MLGAKVDRIVPDLAPFYGALAGLAHRPLGSLHLLHLVGVGGWGEVLINGDQDGALGILWLGVMTEGCGGEGGGGCWR